MIERQNPLPIGRYWVDVPETHLDSFEKWLAKNSVSVKVLTTEESQDSDLGAVTWYLFETVTPYAEWEGPGFPTVADDNVQSMSDTGTARTEDEIRDGILDDVSASLGSGPKVLMWGAAILGGILIARELRR